MPSIRSLVDQAMTLLKKLEWAGPLLVRLIAGLVFVTSGWGKLHNLGGVTEFFTQLGIPLPHAQAIMVSTIEFVGGAFLIVGFATRIASGLLLSTMVVALLTAVVPKLEALNPPDDVAEADRPTKLDAAVELSKKEEAHYVAMFVWLLVSGAGAVSVDRMLRRPTEPRSRPVGTLP